MTAPVPSAPSSPNHAETDPRRRPFSWHRPLVGLTFVTLAAALGVVVVSAAPAVARELGWTSARTVYRASPKTESAGRAGAEALEQRERMLGPDDDDLDQLIRPPGDGKHGTDKDLSKTLSELHLEEATVRKKTSIYTEPGSEPAALLEAGRQVFVMNERQGYLHVLFREFGRTVSGWVKASDVTVHSR